MPCHCLSCELARCTAFINLESCGALQISIFHCQPVFLWLHSLHCLALLVLPFAACHWQEPSAGAQFSCWITGRREKSCPFRLSSFCSKCGDMSLRWPHQPQLSLVLLLHTSSAGQCLIRDSVLSSSYISQTSVAVLWPCYPFSYCFYVYCFFSGLLPRHDLFKKINQTQILAYVTLITSTPWFCL